MSKKQMTSLLVLAMVWLFGCGFVSISQEVNGGVSTLFDDWTESEVQAMKENQAWENRCMANVTEYVTIRKEADQESEAVGRLRKGDAAVVVERGSQWTHIVSGDCDGYAASEYLVFGKEAKAVAERDCGNVATVTADALKVRKEPSQDAKVYDQVAKGGKLSVIREEGEWLVVDYQGKEAYIHGDYAEVAFEVGEAQTMEEVRAAEKKAEEEREKAALQKKYDAVAAHGNDVEVLAAIIQMEAGNQPYEGQLAVGAVVMNRVRSGSYPNTIADVIFAPGQFPPAHTDRFQQVLANGPKASCMQAAKEALNGVSNIGSYTHFKSSKSSVSGSHIVIGNHVFY